MRTIGNYDPDQASDETALTCHDPSLTRQSEKEEADINTIVRNFGVTGRLPESIRVPTYGDFDQVNDFQSAMEAINQANRSFLAMPAETRARFFNDPQVFLEFCSDSRNLDEMRKMGLAVPLPEPPAPAPAPVPPGSA